VEASFRRSRSAELIVVDNGSSDGTRPIVERFTDSAAIDVTYVHEPAAGLSHARNAGIAAAHHAIVAFTDDDCLPDSTWIESIAREFEGDEALAGLSGRVERWDPADSHCSTLSFSDRMDIVDVAGVMQRTIGCNIAISRQALEIVELFDASMGKGTAVGSGEDTDLMYRLCRRGLKVVYSPDVVVRHAHGRREGTTIDRLREEYARGRGAFYCKHGLRGDAQVIRHAAGEVHYLLRAGFGTRRTPWTWRHLRMLAEGAGRWLLSGRARRLAPVSTQRTASSSVVLTNRLAAAEEPPKVD
jgi:GT2 family glycosyltransferase